jgi:DNA-binding CsgD family transcriptional regulator
MSGFDETLMNGYTENTKMFDEWCKRASNILGNITQCGIFEFDSSGHGFFLANRPEYGEEYLDQKGYLFDKDIYYSKQFTHQFDFQQENLHGEFVFELSCPLLDIEYGFSYREAFDQDTIRYYSFHSDDSQLCNNLINNLSLFTKFLQMFKEDNSALINKAKDNKVNFAELKEDYFVEKRHIGKTDREKINTFLQDMGLISKDQGITAREWYCIILHKRGYSASRTGEILGISRRTVETHFDNIKRKLNVASKYELIDYLN